MPQTGPQIPAWIKLGYTGFAAVWLPVYWVYHGPANFLWLCNLGNLLILIGLWTESPLVMSWQAVGLPAVQLGWIVDLAGRLALGFHPIGATEYMFDAATPLAVRALSLYHTALPLLLLWSVHRLGYDRRAIWWQCAITWLVLPIGFFWFEERNLNMVHAPFNRPLTVLPKEAWFAACFVLYPVVLYLPIHLLLLRWELHSRSDRGTAQ